MSTTICYRQPACVAGVSGEGEELGRKKTEARRKELSRGRREEGKEGRNAC